MLGRHVLRVLGDLGVYSLVTRRVALLLTFVLGLAVVAVGLIGKAAAPFVIYPFV